MKHTQEFTIQVNGKTITAKIQLDAPGLAVEDCLSPQMILSAIGSGRKMEYRSRHHKDRVATVFPGVAKIKAVAQVKTEHQDKPALRLVA